MALAELLTLVAVMVIWVPTLAAGAVKMPSLAIDPADADQVTAELLVPCTVAVNRSCEAGLNAAVRGETAIWIWDEGSGPDAELA